MQFLVILVIIIGYCLILGVDAYYILSAGAILLCVFSGFLTLFFVCSNIGLLFAKRKEARFIRFEEIGKSKFKAACYLVEGEEYSCIFPEEGFLEDKLYREDKTYHVMLNKKMRKVYDRFAVTTCLLGLVFSVGLSLGIALLYFL